MRTKLDISQPGRLYASLNRFISATVLLSAEEECALALNESAEARDRLILSYLPLVKSIAFNFKDYGIDLKDLFDQGVIGLIKAVDRYEPTRGRLSTHVEHDIQAEKARTQKFMRQLETDSGKSSSTQTVQPTEPTDAVQNEVTGGKQYTAKGTDTRQENTDTTPSAATLENPSPEITPEEIGEILAEEEESNEYPEVPPDFPFSVVWTAPEEQRAQIPPALFEELELMSLVMIKLWNEGDHDFAGAFMANGRVYPTYPDVAYVKWEETEEPGGRRISEVSTVDSSISEQLLDGVIPPGIEIVDQDASGIDPHAFLLQ